MWFTSQPHKHSFALLLDPFTSYLLGIQKQSFSCTCIGTKVNIFIKPCYTTPEAISKGCHRDISKFICKIITALLTVSRTCNQSRCPSADEWRMWYLCNIEICSIVKRNKSCSKMYGTRKYTLNKVIQTQKNQHHLFSLRSHTSKIYPRLHIGCTDDTK